ncbi:MAG: response regulator [Scytonema sp. PMC 1069.18]|nr:response regulator [Scytonema sp. PMC 1069.18]MEC4888017.1 response regulator [Scytonema sp. PMC 1070.18]
MYFNPEQGVILIVDDTPVNIKILFSVLENYGFKILVAEDGESAVKIATHALPDLILLDVLMPEIDGFETCYQLKNNPATQDIPIIFITALNDKTDRIKGLNIGAVDYITKPLEPEEVLARINIHLRLRNLTKQLAEQNKRLEQEIRDRQRIEEEKEQAFRALQESEARFRYLVESNIIGMVLADLSGNIKEANDAFLQMVGYQREELESGELRWDKMTPPEYLILEEKAIAQISSTGVCSPFEKEYIRKDGSRIPVIVACALLEKSPQLAVGFVLDITERKRSEQKIREQAALLDITTDAILVRDLNHNIQFWNKGAERLYGWMKEQALGKNVNELLYKRKKLPPLSDIHTALAERGNWQGELHQVTKDGKEIIVASRWTVVLNEKGQTKSILTVNTDVTEKKQIEAQFLRAQRMESVGTLASGIAHDLNNALTPMMMSAQLLENLSLDRQSQEWITILKTNIKRAADLVKQVLWFSRGLESKFTTLQLQDLISEIQQIVKQTFPKTIAIHIDVPESNLWHISGDTTQLHQVLMNLCINARDAMPKGGNLQIAAKNIWIDSHNARNNIDAKVGPYVAITVTDTGMGISREIIDKIFEPFFTTKEVGRGTGLGLSTVMGIVKNHGGFVNVTTQVGKGTEFQIYLPVSQIPETSDVLTENQVAGGNGELIFVIDDDSLICEMTKTSLERNAYKVLVACDGMEAIALYTQHQQDISVVLIDMMMPTMDGLTTIRILKKINSEIKIIAMSGLASNHEMIKALNQNISTFLPKPYSSSELLKNLQVILGKS